MQTNSVPTSAANVPSLTPEQLSPELLKSSITQVVSSLTGKSVDATTLPEMKLSEDMLYASVVHQRLEERFPGAGAKFLSAVTTEYGQNVKDRKRQPLTIAVNHFLHSMVRGRQITNNTKESLMRYAFGKSQLDYSKTTLARVPENPTNTQAPVTGKTTLDFALDRVGSNQAASRKEIKAFKDRLAHNRKLTKEQALDQANVFDRMFPTKRIEAPVAAPPVTTGTPPTGVKPSETDKPGEAPSPAKNVSGPNDFVYKPESEADGKILVMIPSWYRSRAVSASLYDGKDEKKLFDFQSPRYGDDNRPYFRSNRSAKEFSGATTVRIALVDGSEAKLTIPNMNEYFTHSY